METSVGQQFAAEWVDAWNARDLERILGHFDEGIVFTSPLAARIIEGSGGVVRGKEQLRNYWREGLDRSPELHFEIENLYLGVEAMVIHYRNHSGGLVNEVLIFNGPLVAEGHATYLVA